MAEKLTVPVLYLRAQEDVLIGRRSVEEIRSAIQNVDIREIPGPHLLFQAAPHSCWGEIRRFVLAV
jgi:pimeloyl-ACP methyl ester carboxylesterase